MSYWNVLLIIYSTWDRLEISETEIWSRTQNVLIKAPRTQGIQLLKYPWVFTYKKLYVKTI